MRIQHRALLLASLVCTGCSSVRGLLPSAGTTAEQLARSVTIVRDSWGVPYILAETDAGAMFGLGYVQAEDDFRRIEEGYLHALGRASHWYGEAVLASDLVMKAFEVERLGREEYEREPPERRALWDAFAAGINHYVRTSGERPRLITTIEPWMPFALMRAQRLEGTFDGVRLGVLPDPSEGVGAGVQLIGVVDSSHTVAKDASFALAVAPARTAAAHAVLIVSTYGPFAGPGRPYEFMVLSDEGWHMRGAAVLGTPVPQSGYNGHIAWARTTTYADVADATDITFDHPTDPASYRVQGEWRTAVDRVDTLLVNSPAGVVPRAFRFRSTVHGPVVAAQGERSLALRIAGLEEGGVMQQSHAMSRAESLAGFRAALESSDIIGIVTYADTAGNIMQSTADLADVLNPGGGWVAAGDARARLAADSAYSVEQLAALPFDVYLPRAEAEIAALAREWEQVGGRNAERARTLDAAIDALRSWDSRAAPESEAATLYLLWQEQLRRAAYLGEFTRFRAMESVLAGLERHHGSTAVPWGAVNRLQRAKADAGETFSNDRPALGVGGAPAWTGSAFVIDVADSPVGAARYAVAGQSWISIVELGSRVSIQSVIPFGQSADPASPNHLDQMALYARGQLKSGPFGRDEVLSGSARAYNPGGAVRELP